MFQNPKLWMNWKHKKDPNRFARPVKAKMSFDRNPAVSPERELPQLAALLKTWQLRIEDNPRSAPRPDSVFSLSQPAGFHYAFLEQFGKLASRRCINLHWTRQKNIWKQNDSSKKIHR